jgi:hypothetical protein
MEINQVPNTAPASASSPAYQPGFATRMQHSKALVAIVAVLGVTVMALAAALVPHPHPLPGSLLKQLNRCTPLSNV